MTGRQAFMQRFSHSEHGRLQVFLGAESLLAKSFDITEHVASYYGFVPLGLEKDDERTRRMYLGSAVDIATIVHEFGHVIDRSADLTAHLDGKVGHGEFRLMNADDKYGINLNRNVLDYAIEGFVGKQYLAQELLADLFMTAVLDPAVSDTEYRVDAVGDRVYSDAGAVLDDPVAVFATFNSSVRLFKCGRDAPCISRPIQWEDTEHARTTARFLRKVIRNLLPG